MNFNMNSGYGRAMLDAIHAAVPGLGRVFIVLNSADTDERYQRLQEIFGYDPKGGVRFLTDVEDAMDQMVTNNNDVMVLDGDSSHALANMLTISKNRVHFVGLDHLLGIKRHVGQSSKLTMGVTTATADVFAIKNLGVRNSFRGLKISNGNTVTENVAAFGEGGEYTYFENCEFYDSTELDSDTHAELVLNGDSPKFKDCTFGSLADAVSGNKIRPAILMTKETVGAGKVSRDVLFENCKFWKKAGGTTTAFIKIAADADLERGMELKDCTFMASKLGSVPAVAIDSPTLTNGHVILTGNTIAANCTKIATATGVLNGTPARVATATIAIQAT